MKSEKKMINKDFMLYLIGRMVFDTGSTIQMMIMPLYIIDIGGTAATIGIFSFLSSLPILAFCSPTNNCNIHRDCDFAI
ncbi:MAG: hypothetical protein AB2421_12560 [Thermotaleaceae bacterium]